MKKLLIIILGLIGVAQAQTVGQFRYDTTKFLKSPGFNEVKIQNNTMDSLGIAVNKGKGWLQWERPKAVPGGIKIGNDTILISGDDTTGIGSLFIRNITTQENKTFNVKSGRVDSLYASTSAGGRIVSNSGSVAAEWGVGGGRNFDFHGFAGYNLNRASNYTARSFTDKNYVDSSLLLKTTVTSYGKNAGGDSTILLLSNGSRYAAKDSVGGGGGSGWGLTGNAGTDTAINFIGTTDSKNLMFRTNGVVRASIEKTRGDFKLSFPYLSGSIPMNFTQGSALPSGQAWNTHIWGNWATSSDNTFFLGNATSPIMGMNTAGVSIYKPLAISSTSVDMTTPSSLFNMQYFQMFNIYPYVGHKMTYQTDVCYALRNIDNSNSLLLYPAGSIGIGKGIVRANEELSSALTVTSTTKGVLFPRMTTTQRNAIATPATGLQIFSTTDSTNYIYRGTTSGWQATITGIRGSATLDFGSTSAQTSAELTITVTGASDGDVVSVSPLNAAYNANTNYTARVSSANTVSVAFNNFSAAAVDPASAVFKVVVFK